jgi:hypothetical protein
MLVGKKIASAILNCEKSFSGVPLLKRYTSISIFSDVAETRH